MSSHAAEALAFVAAAGGLIAAARLYQASRAQHQTEREARFDASATKSVRSTHDPSEMALGPGPDGTPGPVEVEHFPLMHLRDQFPDAETFQSPLVARKWPRNQNFRGENEEILTTQVLNPHHRAKRVGVKAFQSAGPCETLYWDPATVRAAIVTCGGLCPGLNTVIREIVMCLHYTYGVKPGNVLGVHNGYRGFYEQPMSVLTPEDVSNIQREGGTILGSSRGGFDLEKILASLTTNRVNVVFVIGGDGTHRGALQLLKGATMRGIKLSVGCVPKTIDNDIGLIDKSFGFETAVEQAVVPLTCAHTEALAAKNGVGLVKLMGRQSGFIALYASLASRDVNVTLIPEAPWRLSSLLAYLEKRLETRGHCLIAVAEGAEALEQKEAREAAEAAAKVVAQTPTASAGDAPAPGAAAAAAALPPVKRDESGNPVLEDIGVWLKDRIIAHFKKAGKPLNLKYIDPSYIIRSAPANAADSNYCTMLAFNCVHGAMGGFTGFTVGTVDNTVVWIPITVVASQKPRLVDPEGRIYARLCNFTGQPNLAY